MTELPFSFDRLPESVTTDGIRVLVGFRDEMARYGLEAMLKSLPLISKLTVCRSSRDVMRICGSDAVDVVIMQWPTDSDFAPDMAEQFTHHGVKTLLLLDNADRKCVSAATDLQVDGFLLRSELTVEFLNDALSSLLRGGMPLPARLAREILNRAGFRNQVHGHQFFQLTPREQQALNLLAEGLSNRQIARRLSISEHGAKRHVASVLAKLNCRNRTLAVARAFREGLVVSP